MRYEARGPGSVFGAVQEVEGVGGIRMKIEWKKLPGFEGLYEIRNDGYIRSLTRSGSSGRVLKQHLVRGYNQVWLSKNNKITKLSVHRAVLMAFDRLPKTGEVCNHKDGNKLNNNIENLEWCSREENEAHKRGVLGHDDKGARNGHFGYRKAKLYPSENLRNNLCALGVPRWKHNLAELGEILGKEVNNVCRHGNGEWRCYLKNEMKEMFADTESNARAKLLIYLIEQGIVNPKES